MTVAASDGRYADKFVIEDNCWNRINDDRVLQKVSLSASLFTNISRKILNLIVQNFILTCEKGKMLGIDEFDSAVVLHAKAAQ